jgi:hypothetical protein
MNTPDPATSPPLGELPRTPLRRRVLVAALAIATALTIAWSLIYRPGDAKRGLPFAAPASAPAAASAASAVGGKATVVLIPAPPMRL